MKIRSAIEEDAEEISRLIKSAAHCFTVNADGSGAEDFLKLIEPQAIRKYIEATEFQYFAGLVQDQIVGVVAIREKQHLFHLFVAEPYQGKGLARKLWEHAKHVVIAASNTQRITVNSTVSAVPVYERFGFNKIGGKTEAKGIAYIPMAVDLSSTMSANMTMNVDANAGNVGYLSR
jgi:GNAT superfamily N-acetyltransferase